MTAEIDVTTVEMTHEDETDLVRLEKVIETGMTSFVAVGTDFWRGVLDEHPHPPTAADIDNARQRTPPPLRTPPREPPRRKPVPDVFRTRLSKTIKATNSFEKLINEEHWDANLETLRGIGRADVERLIQSLQNVRDALDGGGTFQSLKHCEVTVTVGPNSAFVSSLKTQQRFIRGVLKQLGAPQQPARAKQITFPAQFAQPLVDHLLANHIVATLVVDQ